MTKPRVGGRPKLYHPHTDTAIVNYIRRNPNASFREVADDVGLPLSTFHRYLRSLVKTGRVTYKPYQHRTLEAVR